MICNMLNKLNLNNDKAVSIESSARNQANDPEWFNHLKNRFLHLYVMGLVEWPKNIKGF